VNNIRHKALEAVHMYNMTTYLDTKTDTCKQLTTSSSLMEPYTGLLLVNIYSKDGYSNIQILFTYTFIGSHYCDNFVQLFCRKFYIERNYNRMHVLIVRRECGPLCIGDLSMMRKNKF
jgi:hypothetical protein